MTVDATKKRVGLYHAPSAVGNNLAELSSNVVTGEVMIVGAGRENMTCPQTYTFALSVSKDQCASCSKSVQKTVALQLVRKWYTYIFTFTTAGRLYGDHAHSSGCEHQRRISADRIDL